MCSIDGTPRSYASYTRPPSKNQPAIQLGKREENLMKIVRLFVAVCKDPEMAQFETKKRLCLRLIWITSDGHARFVIRQVYGRV
jgi:hypothetical protein